MIKEDAHLFQGMRRDNHPIRQDGKYLWDAHNIRLTNREDNTLLSITNEKGTSEPLLKLEGKYTGHCTIGKYLVLFTAEDDGSNNTIYRIEKTSEGYKYIILFKNPDKQDGSWSPDHPMETLGVYETEFIQKIYWVDGVNQPRMINIAKPELIFEKTISDGTNTYEVLHNGVNLSGPIYSNERFIDQHIETTLKEKGLYSLDSFNFIRSLELKETISVERQTGNGLFAPGTVQYAFSYYNKYEQETNIVQVTPIQYVSYNDRGASPEDSVSNTFEITINHIDDNFEYIRLYSIHRTSIDTVPQVKVVADISLSKISEESVTFTDDGTIGYTIDPDQLLYTGGRSIIATTMTLKDNTLFLGNITLLQYKNFEDVIKGGESSFKIIPDILLEAYDYNQYKVKTYYNYENSLHKGYNARFQSGEYYRCGVLVLVKDGTWSDPIFLGDEILCTDPPFGSSTIASINLFNVNKIREAGIKRIRSCIVFPRSYERTVLCEGILCPTVYSAADRKNNSPYASSSWFFRPATNDITNSKSTELPYKGTVIQYQHNKPLFAGKYRGAEIQNMIASDDVTSVNSINSSNFEKYKNYYFIDENIVTFHSPDIEFDTDLQHTDWENVKLDIIGIALLGAISGDIDITATNPGVDVDDLKPKGFLHNHVGFPTPDNNFFNSGLTAGLFYDSNIISTDYKEGKSTAFMVYPWHRSGSLNNDANRPISTETNSKGARTAVLKTKVISNLKFFTRNLSLPSEIKRVVPEGTEETKGSPNPYKITTPLLFNQDFLSMVRVAPDYFKEEVPYMGNIDTLSTSSEKYPFYIGGSFESTIQELTTGIQSTLDPVRIKYKSSPHLVFSIKGEKERQIKLLPRMKGFGSLLNGSYTFPDWQITKPGDTGNNKSEGEFAFLDCVRIYGEYKPLPSDVGKYIYESNDEFFTLARVISVPGTTFFSINYEPVRENEITIKFASGRSITSFSHYGSKEKFIPPGTDPEDKTQYEKINKWDYRYIGPDKYYKLTKIAEHKNHIFRILGMQYLVGTVYEYKIEDVTPSTSTLPASTEATEVTEAPVQYTLSQDLFGNNLLQVSSPYMLVARLIKEVPADIRFGGSSEEAIRQNLWLPAGDPVNIPDPIVTTDEEGNETIIEPKSITVPILYGDTWYSRYDCLKTYPYTTEDENQVVEIGSFMCETRVNIDGRYDKNRGLISNNSVLPINFNLINPIYSQKDNFFNYNILDKDYYKQDTFINQITWSKEKLLGEDIDTWTNIPVANILNMNGDRDSITALRVWNDQLFCFLKKALSKISFNSRVEIPVSDGVPIEITSGRKVDGSVLINDQIGCTNKWSIVPTPSGLYFIDSNSSNIYSLTDKLSNLSSTERMSWWVRESYPEKEWTPYGLKLQINGIRGFYDIRYGDIYFSPGLLNVPGHIKPEPREALCYSEALGKFTSFMNYGGVQAMFNFDNGFYSLKDSVIDKDSGLTDAVALYQNNVGEYNNFYGEYKGWSFSFISNPDSYMTKVFDNIDTRADRYEGNIYPEGAPFQWILTKNEYQDTGKVEFNKKTLVKKFRVWRGVIPRHFKTNLRIRNPWSMITLGVDNNKEPFDNAKTVIHDMIVRYTI